MTAPPAAPATGALIGELVDAAAEQLTGTAEGRRLAAARDPGGGHAPDGVIVERPAPGTAVYRMPATCGPGPLTPDPHGPEVAIVVVDGTVPIGADELRLLAGLPFPPELTVLAVDETAGPAGPAPAQVRAAARAVLAEYAPGFAARPLVAAGDTAAIDAAARAARAAATGLDPVAAVAVSALDWRVARARRELARLARPTPADRRRAEAVRRRTEATGPDGLPVRLGEARTRYAELKVELGHLAAAHARRLAAAARTDLDTAAAGELAVYPDRLAVRIDRAGTELVERASTRLGRPVRIEAAPAQPDGPGARARWATEDRLVLVMGASAGLGASRLVVAPLALVPALELLVVPVMLALGLVAAGWIVRARTVTAQRQRMRAWAAETIAEVRGEWERVLATAVLAAESAHIAAITAEHTRRIDRIDAEIRRIDDERGQAAAQRAELARRTGRELSALEHLAAELADCARVARAGRR